MRPVSCTITKTIVDICDDFDEDPLVGGDWVLRTPLSVAAGPTVNVEDHPGYLRFYTPSAAMAGQHFDNWAGVDLGPSLERYDMGTRDWLISTRLEWPEEIGSPPGTHHVGLMFAYGRGQPDDPFNDVTYWGQYGNATTLRVERTGAALTPQMAYDGAPVSLQVQKAGTQYTFSHRQDDGDDWINDATYSLRLPFPNNPGASPPAGTPVSRVGLLIKTWGGGAPEVTADFDYFCLQVADSPPEAKIIVEPPSGSVPLEVAFSAADSEDPSGGTLTFKWDFGDGATGEGEIVRHTYTAPGIVTVTLTATDDEKNVGTATVDLYLSDDTSPLALVRLGTQGQNGIARVDRSGAQPAYCLEVGGGAILGTTDQGFFLQKKVAGDFKVTAKITAGDLSVGRPKAGIMARLGLDAKSANAMMEVDGDDDGYGFQYRRLNNSGTARKGGPAATPLAGLPAWVQLERQASLFIGSYSTDGSSFVEYHREDIPNLNVPELFVGFAASSGDITVVGRYCAELSFGDEVPPEDCAAPGDEDVDGKADCADEDCAGLPICQAKRFHRGDADDNGSLQLTDAIRILGFLFLGGLAPSCMVAADADDNGTLQLTDAIRILGFLFLGGPPPAPPGPPPESSCGSDPPGSPDLGCETYSNC
ncbi:MAG: PKD domain-containing protein [Planctomycetes bacterium]|nr:PKD domain-containing protein [Planctomycetota bacterium]